MKYDSYIILIKNQYFCWKPVTQACNPSCLEAEIRRIAVRGQLGQIVLEVPSPK
jgi:hypothetical protein